MTATLQIRMHRDTFAASMATLATIPATRDALRVHLTANVGWAYVRSGMTEYKIEGSRYGFDKRNGWETYLVTLDGFPVAWIDGPLP